MVYWRTDLSMDQKVCNSYGYYYNSVCLLINDILLDGSNISCCLINVHAILDLPYTDILCKCVSADNYGK